MRFAPWFPNPRVVVTEMTPPNCNATHPATNWDSTAFDEVMSDFYSAVCGPGAADGACERSVVQQLSTMPSWLFVDGYDYTKLPADPWNTPDPFDVYTAGSALKDPSCAEMARYFARLAGWYTAGGFHDECGHWHASGLRYAWYGLSILNEDEHRICSPTAARRTRRATTPSGRRSPRSTRRSSPPAPSGRCRRSTCSATF